MMQRNNDSPAASPKPATGPSVHTPFAFPAALLAAAALAGCASDRGLLATVGPDYEPQAPRAAPGWQAPQPHGGDAKALAQWWRRFDDGALASLIEAAQRESASLAQAAARIEQARASAVAAGAGGMPSLDAIGSANRSAFTFGGPALIRNQVQLGVQSSWEIDLFGGLARQREAAAATLAASAASWHDARVSVAAETANAYVNYRYCEMQRAIADTDTVSRRETARITEAASQAGFQSPAAAALAQATAADAANGLAQRRTQCEIALKGLVALTALEEPALRGLLATRAARLPEPAQFRVDAVPARVVAQRPDVAAAERDLAAASARVGVQEAGRYPSLSIAGNILPSRISIDGGPALTVNTWSIGPSVALPIADGGRRAANSEAARAQYAALDVVFRSRVRNAVREVEEALVRLAGAGERIAELDKSTAGLKANLDATEVRVTAGFANHLELQDARRAALSGEANLAAWRQERISAWIALYRAAGGGWDGDLSIRTATQ
jgi:multidrug efflux system outer membrane protein